MVYVTVNFKLMFRGEKVKNLNKKQICKGLASVIKKTSSYQIDVVCDRISSFVTEILILMLFFSISVYRMEVRDTYLSE